MTIKIKITWMNFYRYQNALCVCTLTCFQISIYQLPTQLTASNFPMILPSSKKRRKRRRKFFITRLNRFILLKFHGEKEEEEGAKKCRSFALLQFYHIEWKVDWWEGGWCEEENWMLLSFFSLYSQFNECHLYSF